MYVVFSYNNTVISATSDMVFTQIIKSLIANRSIVSCLAARAASRAKLRSHGMSQITESPPLGAKCWHVLGAPYQKLTL